MNETPGLAELLARATGADAVLDAEVARFFKVEDDAYTASALSCRDLARQRLAGWRLHVGYGASGMFPYAAFSRQDERIEAEAPTLPLAILRAACAALAVEGTKG